MVESRTETEHENNSVEEEDSGDSAESSNGTHRSLQEYTETLSWTKRELGVTFDPAVTIEKEKDDFKRFKGRK